MTSPTRIPADLTYATHASDCTCYWCHNHVTVEELAGSHRLAGQFPPEQVRRTRDLLDAAGLDPSVAPIWLDRLRAQQEQARPAARALLVHMHGYGHLPTPVAIRFAPNQAECLLAHIACNSTLAMHRWADAFGLPVKTTGPATFTGVNGRVLRLAGRGGWWRGLHLSILGEDVLIPAGAR